MTNRNMSQHAFDAVAPTSAAVNSASADDEAIEDDTENAGDGNNLMRRPEKKHLVSRRMRPHSLTAKERLSILFMERSIVDFGGSDRQCNNSFSGVATHED
jgi:hypothetical protein